MIAGGTLGAVNLGTAWVLAAVWLVHIFEAARGMPQITDICRPDFDVPAEDIASHETQQRAPKVTIVVPARNEALTIEPALRSLRNIDYPNYELVVVNDRSTDATGEIIDRLASETDGAAVRVIHVRELPPGWLGKTHAMWTGAQAGTC